MRSARLLVLVEESRTGGMRALVDQAHFFQNAIHQEQKQPTNSLLKPRIHLKRISRSFLKIKLFEKG